MESKDREFRKTNYCYQFECLLDTNLALGGAYTFRPEVGKIGHFFQRS